VISPRPAPLVPLFLLVGSLLATACSASSGDEPIVVEGVVIAVDGDLTNVTSFTLRLPDGSDLVLMPAAGVLFHGSAPISHVRDHLASGAPVRVGYVELDDGTLSAVLVEDV